MIHLDIR